MYRTYQGQCLSLEAELGSRIFTKIDQSAPIFFLRDKGERSDAALKGLSGEM